MKRLTLLLLVFFVLFSLSAAFIPFSDYGRETYFSSPSLIRGMEEKTPFGIRAEAKSGIDTLRFLSNPEGFLSEIAENEVYLTLMDKTIGWWKENRDVANVLSSFDSAFQNFDSGSDDLDLFYVRQYLSTVFLSEEYGDGRRAYVTANLAGNSELFPPGSGKGGDAALLVELYGSRAKNNFAWGWNVNLGIEGSEELLGSRSGVFGLDVRAMIGYAFSLSDRLDIGISCIPLLRMETYVLPQSFIRARMNNSVVTLFSEDFRFGMGITLNAGISYRVNDELRFTLDGVKLPSMRNYWSLSLTQIVSGDISFKRISDTWLEIPDVVFGAHWERNGHCLDARMGNVVSQLIWKSQREDFVFNFLNCPEIRYSYTFSSSGLVLSGGLGGRNILFGLEWNGLSFEAFWGSEEYQHVGVIVGYEF